MIWMDTLEGELRDESKDGVEAELALKIVCFYGWSHLVSDVKMMSEAVELLGLLWVGRGAKEIAEQLLTCPHWN